MGKPVTDDPDDAPELLNDFFRHGELRYGDRLIRRGLPPISGKPKTAITPKPTITLDEDVVQAYRETGEGWQTRINADLRRARKQARPGPQQPRVAQSAALSPLGSAGPVIHLTERVMPL